MRKIHHQNRKCVDSVPHWLPGYKCELRNGVLELGVGKRKKSEI